MLITNTENLYFNPGCALILYRPDLVEKIYAYLKEQFPTIQMHTICCRKDPQLPAGSTIITICTGCDKYFAKLHEGIKTVNFWPLIDELGNFPLPDYKNELTMTIHDACDAKLNPVMHDAVRNILAKMHVNIVEAEYNRMKSICCGDSLYGKVSKEKLQAAMKRRANGLPCENVLVYCVTCIKSIKNGGKTPVYLGNLVFGEPETDPQDYNMDHWHEGLKEYIETH